MMQKEKNIFTEFGTVRSAIRSFPICVIIFRVL